MHTASIGESWDGWWGFLIKRQYHWFQETPTHSSADQPVCPDSGALWESHLKSWLWSSLSIHTCFARVWERQWQFAGPRPGNKESQDVWAWHLNFVLEMPDRRVLRISMRSPRSCRDKKQEWRGRKMELSKGSLVSSPGRQLGSWKTSSWESMGMANRLHENSSLALHYFNPRLN